MTLVGRLSERERDLSWRDGERLIRFGADALSDAPDLLHAERFEGYALVTTTRALDSAPEARALADGAAEVAYVPAGGVPEAAASIRQSVSGRPLVALGGGRVIDSAKAVTAADGLRVAAVPTTLSGADLTRIHRLPAGVERPRDGLVRPALVLAEPGLMTSQPRTGLTASAMNALAHGAEALYGPRANPVAEAAALRGAELIARGLEDVDEGRASLALGALLCGWAVDATGLALHHALCQTIVRLAGTPHAETNAVMLPHVLGYVARSAPIELGRLAAALGAASPDPALAAARARALADGAGVRKLSELGVGRGRIDEIVATVPERAEVRATPGQPGEQEVRELLVAAL